LAAVCVPLPLRAQAAEPLTSRLDAFLHAWADLGYLSGNVLVGRGDSVLYQRAFGLANREHGVPFTGTTRSNIASITKPMTIVVAARLVDEGKLRPEQTLADFIPDFPRGDVITVSQLLNHRAGIPHRVTRPEEETVPRTAADMVELAKRVPLLFEPGTESVYSSGGYSVLARVLEIAGGQPYERLLDRYLFAPTGMAHSAHVDARTVLPERAAPYQWGPEGLVNSPFEDLSYLVGAGSVYSTAGDLFRMMLGLVNGSLGATARQELVRESGLSWNGATSGFRAFADWSAATDVTVILTANVVSGANDLIRRDVPRIVAGEVVPAPSVPSVAVAAVSEDALRRYEGSYEFRPRSPMDVRVAFGGLLVDQWYLVPTSDTSFFSPQDFGTVTAVFGPDGAVQRFDWVSAGGAIAMTRVGPRVPR